MKTIFRIFVILLVFFLLEYYNVINTNFFNKEKVISFVQGSKNDITKEFEVQTDTLKREINE